MAINLGEIQNNNNQNDYKIVDGLKLSKINNNQTQKWYNNFLKTPEAFKDGYQFGDITKTIGGTAVDIATGVGKGAMNLGDSIARTASGIVAETSDVLGNKKLANKIRNNLATKENPLITKTNEIQSKIDKSSISGNILDKVAESVGYTATLGSAGKILGPASNIPIGKLNMPTLAAVSGAGSGFTEAYKKGASGDQAWIKALGSGAVEGVTEGLFGMFGVGGNEITDQWAKQATNHFKSGIAKVLAKSGVSSAGESAEEFLSYLGNQGLNLLLDKISTEDDPKFYEKWNWEEVGEEMAVAFMSSGLAQGGSTAINIQTQTQSAIQQAQNELGRALTNNEIETIKNKVIESVISEEEANKNNNQNNITDILQYNTLKSQQANNNQEVYQYQESNNQKINNFRKSLVDNNFNNSQEAHNLAYVFEKIIDDKNYNILFDNTITNDNGESVNAQITTNNNGEIEIRLNPDSDRAGEFLLVHEISHAIKSDEMIKLVNDFATRNTNFAEAVKEIEARYSKDLTNEEVFSDVCGQLFGNQEFINSLQMENTVESRSIIKQIYEQIKYLLNKLTQKGRYRNFISNLESKWREAYKATTIEESIKNLNGESKYSTIGIRGAKNLKNNINERRYNKLYSLLKTAKEISNDYKNISLEQRNILTKKSTGWFQTKYGDWGTLITDKDSKILKQLEPNKTYKLGDILKHNLLYKAYPGLESLKVKAIDFNDSNAYAGYRPIKFLPDNTLTNDIVINNNWINKTDFKKTLLHEVNHFIEGYEKFNKNSRGADSSEMSIEEYRNNLGEIISNETKILADLTQGQLDNILLLEQGKENPSYENIRNAIRLVDKIDKQKGENYVIRNNRQISEIKEENQTQVVEKTSRTNSRRNTLNDNEELDNSSFSLKENNNYRGSHQIQNAKSIINLDLNQIKEKIIELNGYLTNQDQKDFNKLKRILNSSTENIKIYRAAPVNELNSGDWVTTDRSYAQNVANNNGGKVYEFTVNPNKLYYPDNVKDLPSLHRLSSFQYVNDNVKYSQNNSKWQEHLEDNYKTTGTRTYFEDIKINKKIGDNILKTKQDMPKNPTKEGSYDNTRTQQDYLNENNNYSMDSKIVNKITKNMKQELSLEKQDIDEFKRVLSEISRNPNISKNEIKEIISNKFSEKTAKTRLEDVFNIQNVIRNYKINVSDDIKIDIADYSDFRQRNFGKIRFSKDGVPVDTAYQELSEKYPNYFSKYIINPADQLEEIEYVANLDKYATETGYLDEKTINNATDFIFDSIQDDKLAQKVKEGKLQYEEYLKLSKRDDLKKTRVMVRDELQKEMGITESDLQVGKDISSIDFQRTDPIRVNEKVFGYEIGNKINEATIRYTKHNEAERTRFLNKERKEIADLGIKARSKESAAVQKYGEKSYVNDKGEKISYGDKELALEFPDINTQNKIKNASKEIRKKYNNYIEEINKVITDMGYDPIPKRDDYFRHFQEINDKLSEWGIPLNRSSLKDDVLPTDINGITDQFKPGKNWFASAMERKGLKTTYDAITGIDGYLEGASNLMYHTADIQRYRTLSKMVRDAFGQSHGLENVDLSTKEGQQRLNDIFDNKLSKYAAWLDEQANALAGKKGTIDRGIERALGRKIYSILDTAKKQVGSNMTGFNVRSALTNFASAVQGASKTNKLAFLKGTISTVQNIIHNDELINKSDFLTSRFGSDQLSKKLWQKASNAGQVLMKGSDYFTANQIWRSKYFENLKKGMSETNAIKNADDFAARIMGDRSKGSTAEIFNSKTLGLLTQFQLEVNNQWSSIIHDNKMDIKSGNKSGATALFQLGQLAAFSYMFNNLMKSLTGSDVMIDPIDLLKKIFGKDDDDEDKSFEERAAEALGDIVNDLPFISFLTGGRIPISETFKGGETLLKKTTGQKDKYGNDIKWENVRKDLIESGFYWLLPTGYGQLKKTKRGLSMYNNKLPVAGSYTDSGNLRFTADASLGGITKAALFGQYSSKEAQKYIESGYKTVNSTKIQEMKDLNMSASEYRKYRTNLSNVGTTNESKIDYIANSNYSNNQKNIMAKNVLSRDFNLNEYKKYDSYGEYNYAINNPDKYAVIKQIAPYNDYVSYKNDINNIKNSTKNDKEEIIEYIKKLKMPKVKKAMFIKQYYKSFKDYDDEIVEYINSQKIKKAEKAKIFEQLGFTVKNGEVYW